MYIGSTGPTGLHHLVWEVVDNSVDEAMAGLLHPHRRHPAGRRRRAGSSTTAAASRSSPHPKYPKQSAAEIVLTTLHAGGKFGGEGYKVSGGLHGVGVSVVNALSTRLVLEIDRDGEHYGMRVRGRRQARRASSTVDRPGRARRAATGTTVTFWPDAVDLRGDRVPGPDRPRAPADHGLPEQGPRDPLRRRAHRPGEPQTTFKYNGGIVDFVKHLNASKESLFRKVGSFEQAEDDQEVEIALQWNTGYHECIHSFANGISTIEGGMHEEGFKKALTNVVNSYARASATC